LFISSENKKAILFPKIVSVELKEISLPEALKTLCLNPVVNPVFKSRGIQPERKLHPRRTRLTGETASEKNYTNN
jgi:hypothetical protein